MMLKRMTVVSAVLLSVMTMVSQRPANVPESAIYGDFNGDSLKEWVWIETNLSSDEMESVTPPVLRSTNKTLDRSLKWDDLSYIGVMLVNLGNLNKSVTDYLGAVPYGCAGTWHMYYTYRWQNGKWKEVLEPFVVWCEEDNPVRVYSGDRAGYLKISYDEWNSDLTEVRHIVKSVKMK